MEFFLSLTQELVVFVLSSREGTSSSAYYCLPRDTVIRNLKALIIVITITPSSFLPLEMDPYIRVILSYVMQSGRNPSQQNANLYKYIYYI